MEDQLIEEECADRHTDTLGDDYDWVVEEGVAREWAQFMRESFAACGYHTVLTQGENDLIKFVAIRRSKHYRVVATTWHDAADEMEDLVYSDSEVFSVYINK